MKIYLEGESTSLFIKNEIDRVSNNVDILMSRFSFSEVTNLKAFNDARKKYEKDNAIPRMKEQLKALRFLLKK